MAVERRKLSFTTLDDVAADAENLLARGYDKAGNWDLAQVCGHLTEWLRFPVEGYPKPPLFVRPMLWLMKVTRGKRMLASILANGFPAGGRTMPETIPPPGGDPAAAVASLKDAVTGLQKYTDVLLPSPLFGTLTKDEATKLQLMHCAHHLSFLVPKSN